MTRSTRTPPRSDKRVDGAPPPFLQFDARVVPEHLARGRDVRPRVADVARAIGGEPPLDVALHDPPERVRELIDRRRPPGGHVEHAAVRRRHLGRADRRVDDVLDEGEVARLLAVAEYG